MAYNYLTAQGAEVRAMVFADVEHPGKRARIPYAAPYRASSFKVPFPWDLQEIPSRGWKWQIRSAEVTD
jgi:hypothetical protein